MKTIILLLMLQSLQAAYDAATSDMAAGRWEDAAAKLEQIVKEDPKHIPSEFNLAVCYTKLGKVDRATELYQKILEQDGDVYEARINLGILMIDSGNTGGAEQQFARAADLRPQDPVPVLYTARLFDRRGDANSAREAYEQAIRRDPSHAEARLEAGVFYLKRQEPENAFTNLYAAEQSGLATPELFIALSETEHARHHEDRALAYLERAANLDPDNKNVRRQLGILYREAGQFEKAIETLKPLLPDAKVELAIAYFDDKKFSEAATLFEQLSAADSANADYLYFLGKSQMELKLYARAIASLQQVIQMKPNDPEAYGTLGSTYYMQEDWPHAITAFERFLEIRPKQPLAHFILATCYDKLGNARQALLNYNQFLEFDDGSSDARSFQARQRATFLERRLKK